MNSNIYFSKQLILWYLENKRDLFWRENKIPYRIWISEVILQQTRVEQAKSYFFRFTERFPDVKSLAIAQEQEVLKYWEGLGYYSRARNLHFAAKQIMSNFKGKFPENYEDILSLKGVGEYTAAAIASIAFNVSIPAIDGNVYRVLSRLFAEDSPIDSTIGKKRFKILAQIFFDGHNPGIFNQAMMELGALQCKPKNPDCENCPVFGFCEAAQKKIQLQFPVKKQKTKVSDLYLYYVFIKVDNRISIQKRTGKGIWKNLYELPLIESLEKLEFNDLKSKIMDLFGSKSSLIKIHPEIIHLLSHRKLHVNFISLKTNNTKLNFVDKNKIKQLPFPIVIKRFLESV